MSALLIPSIHLFPTRKPAGTASVALRQIRPDDAAALQDFVRALSPVSRRLRFHVALNELTEAMLQALTHVDQRAHVAFVLTYHERGAERIVGEARYVVSRDEETAEFGIAVADAFRGRGLAERLMARTGRRGSCCRTALARRRCTGRQCAHACLRAPLRLCRDDARREPGLVRVERLVGRPLAASQGAGSWMQAAGRLSSPPVGFVAASLARGGAGFPAPLIRTLRAEHQGRALRH